MREVAIQGELGSNSHMAALSVFSGETLGVDFRLVPCASSFELFTWLCAAGSPGEERCAVLPIENSLHGSVFEHYDLLLEHQVRIAGETLLHIRHNLIALPGVTLDGIGEVRSHPVALSQCRHWLRAHPALRPVAAYDTAGSVKQLVAERLTDVAAIAPELAARHYGAEILVPAIEDHPENYTRFLLLLPAAPENPDALSPPATANKATFAFTLAHEPGTLLGALEVFRRAGLNLTRIESRPVPGRPWEYVFFIDIRFSSSAQIMSALEDLRRCSLRTEVLGLYRAGEM